MAIGIYGSNRSTLVATVGYHDAELPNGTLTWSISADKCYNTSIDSLMYIQKRPFVFVEVADG